MWAISVFGSRSAVGLDGLVRISHANSDGERGVSDELSFNLGDASANLNRSFDIRSLDIRHAFHLPHPRR